MKCVMCWDEIISGRICRDCKDYYSLSNLPPCEGKSSLAEIYCLKCSHRDSCGNPEFK